MKPLLFWNCFFCLFFINVSYSFESLVAPPSGENTGLNKYERIGNMEKELPILVQAINDLRKDQQELKEQIQKSKNESLVSKEEKEKTLRANSDLLNEIAELKKQLAEQKRSLEQVRISLYGEEGKAEKDALLKKK